MHIIRHTSLYGVLLFGFHSGGVEFDNLEFYYIFLVPFKFSNAEKTRKMIR